MLIGAHVSSSGGIPNSIKNAQNLNIDYFQTFLSAPQSYKVREYGDEEINLFKTLKRESSIKACFAHAIYLLNFASDKELNVKLSKENLITTLNLSAKVDFNGVIIHLGSTKDNIDSGVKAVAEGIKQVLENTDPNSILFLENSAGAGNCIGSKLDHLVDILNYNKGDHRIKVCIDTQHSFAAGYDIKTNPIKYLDEIILKLGSRVQLFHLNDSKTDFDSKKDRHENIGEGKIGYEGLKAFCTDSRVNEIPFILEVPGFEAKGPDLKNIEIVKSFNKG